MSKVTYKNVCFDAEEQELLDITKSRLEKPKVDKPQCACVNSIVV